MNLRDTPREADFRRELSEWLAANRQHAPRPWGDFDDHRVTQWRAWSRRIFDAGYAGLTWPTEHGGRGLPTPYQTIWLEELSKAEAPDHIGIIGLGMAGPTIARWGTPEQKERFLPSILSGEEIWCQGFSEPESGSDLASLRTSACRDDGAWKVDGQKVWSSFGHMADWCLLLVRGDPSARPHAGLSCLLLDMAATGVAVRPIRQITGDAEFSEIFLDGVRIPADLTLGESGDGWRVAMTTLSHERGTHALGLVAQFEADLRAAIALLSRADKRERAPLSGPLIRDWLAELWVDAQALRLTSIRGLDDGPPGPEATICKLRWSELNQRLTTIVGLALGTAALETGPQALDGGRWAFARLRSRGNTIEAGTSEILRNIIAEQVLGLPRSR